MEIQWKDVIRFTQKGNPAPARRVENTKEEWKKVLREDQYRITREKGTEKAWSGEYCELHEPGKYACVCCAEVLFDSGTKFDSKSGWPSFTQPYHFNAVKYEADNSFGMRRVEAMCNVCDAHLGHVFPDGPPPTGLRYCINSLSIVKLEVS